MNYPIRSGLLADKGILMRGECSLFRPFRLPLLREVERRPAHSRQGFGHADGEKKVLLDMVVI